MNCVIIDNFIAFPPTQTCSCFVLYLRILPIQHLFFTLEYYHLYAKNVVRISPPLKDSWYSDASHHHHSFLGPRIDSNKWMVLFSSFLRLDVIADRLPLHKFSLQMCREHHQHSELFQDIYRILDEKYHPWPRWFVLSSTILSPSIQHKLVRVLCCTLISLLSSLWYVLPWSITIFYVKNVVRISPPRMTSWYSDTSPHHHSFLVPVLFLNRNTDNWTMMCEFKIPSNPIALKWMVDWFILILLFIKSSS